MAVSAAGVIALLALWGCPEPVEVGSPATGDGLFRAGCPVAGEARARVLAEPSERPWGEEGLAAPGDVLLLSTAAAFVVQGAEDPRTYYHYGGTPIDAVAVDGCEQSGPELLEELGLVLGRLELTDFEGSVLRQFRADEVVVVSDGEGGGPAVVEARGTDDRFWLVELTLLRQSYANGNPRALHDLFGLDVTVRYTLEPGSAVLHVGVELDGEPTTDGFMAGAIVFPSDDTPVNTFATGDLSVGGFGLDVGVPWLGMGRGEGGLAVAMPGANMAYTSVAGVRALLDVNQALDPLEVSGPLVAETPMLLAVGRTDPASAAASLEPFLDPGAGAWRTVSGVVTDSLGAPVANAAVELRPSSGAGVLDVFWTDDGGHFNGRTLDLGPAVLVVVQEGRDSSSTEVATLAEGLELLTGAPGWLVVNAVDGEGEPIPVRAELVRDDGEVVVVYALPGEAYPLPPGAWTAHLSRGYEYALATEAVTVPEGGTGTLSATMPRVIDTSGWASVDTHVHQEASADSSTLDRDRFRTVAASGLDAFVSTDHEAIVDLAPELADRGFDAWFTYGLGSEVTATVPEHVNAWPFPPEDDDRGSPVRWYQLGLPALYAAIRERGATVVQLNHARVNGECGILCILDWDRQSDPPSMPNPEALGLPPGTEVWSWDFDAFELLNDPRSPMLDPADPQHTGALYDWLAFHNLGYRVAAMGVTDAHGLDIPGSPRTYVAVPDDTVGMLDIGDVDDGILAGATVVSAGAFAEVNVDGAPPGGTASSLAPVLHLRVLALPEVDVQRVDVLVNCHLYASLPTDDPAAVEKLLADLPLDLDGDSYVVTLGWGEWSMPRGLVDYDPLGVPRFVSSPVFVDANDDGVWTPPGPRACDVSPQGVGG